MNIHSSAIMLPAALQVQEFALCLLFPPTNHEVNVSASQWQREVRLRIYTGGLSCPFTPFKWKSLPFICSFKMTAQNYCPVLWKSLRSVLNVLNSEQKHRHPSKSNYCFSCLGFFWLEMNCEMNCRYAFKYRIFKFLFRFLFCLFG